MSTGPVETEIKLRVGDLDDVRRRVEGLGFVVDAPRVFEGNNVYDGPGGELRANGTLLRLRQAGKRNVLTFKGQATPGRHKSRPETEVEVSDFGACDSILRQLGYSLTFRYEKYRTEFKRNDQKGTVTIDETPIGNFMELEGPADWIDETAHLLGYVETEYLTASYGRLYAEFCQSQGGGGPHMVFATGNTGDSAETLLRST